MNECSGYPGGFVRSALFYCPVRVAVSRRSRAGVFCPYYKLYLLAGEFDTVVLFQQRNDGLQNEELSMSGSAGVCKPGERAAT